MRHMTVETDNLLCAASQHNVRCTTLNPKFNVGLLNLEIQWIPRFKAVRYKGFSNKTDFLACYTFELHDVEFLWNTACPPQSGVHHAIHVPPHLPQ